MRHHRYKLYSAKGADNRNYWWYRFRKISLVNLIPRFYDATKGTIRIQGNDINDYDAVQLRDKIGVVMQKAVLFAGTIADNLRWGKNDATEEEMWKALDIAQATEVVKGKEGGLDYMIEQGGKNLSGGQKQRLTIARAVVKDPDILILDDSASALDFATDASLRAALKGMHGTRQYLSCHSVHHLSSLRTIS